jgi:DNA (cytosine-5)-methyltransferase 1
MNELALFAGNGGGILGGKLLGWTTVCAVEISPYRARRLMQRQNEGYLPPFPIWDDVCTFNGRDWQGAVDVVSGGFPCQDISQIGTGQGIAGKRSGLWKQMARIISEVQPQHVLVENSPMLTTRGLGTVLGDLASLGFDAKWGVLGAYHAGLDHKRERIWIVAHAAEIGRQRRIKSAAQERRQVKSRPMETLRQHPLRIDIPAPNAFGNPHGMAHRMDRLQAIGDGQLPAVAAMAWQILNNTGH